MEAGRASWHQAPAATALTNWVQAGECDRAVFLENVFIAVYGAVAMAVPGVKWKRELSPYTIIGDINIVGLKGNARPNILVATSDDGCLHCLDADGSDLWVFQRAGERLASTISVCEPKNREPDKLLLVAARARAIYALDANGQTRWERSLPAFCIFGGPAAAGPPNAQMILHGGDAGRLFCLDTDGNLLWFYRAGGAIHQAASAGDVDGDGRTEIFFGSQDTYLYSLRDDGSLRWRYKTRSIGDGIASRPILCDIDLDGIVEVVFGSWDHHVYCLDAVTGALRWETELKGRIRSGVCVSDLDGDGRQEVLAGDEFGLACLASDGRLIWEFREEGREMIVPASPVVADITGDGRPDVVFGTQSGFLYALDHKGKLIWSMPLGEDQIEAAPLVADLDCDGYLEVVYGTSTGKVVCLQTQGKASSRPPWPMGNGNPNLNPALIPQGAGKGTGSTLALGEPVVSVDSIEGSISLSPGRETVGRSGVRIWWETKPDHRSLREASPLHLFMESSDPDRLVRGELLVRMAGGEGKETTLRTAVSPPTGSTAVEIGLGGLPPEYGRWTISVEYRPIGGEIEFGPELTLRRIERRELLERIGTIRKRLTELDANPRNASEDMTRTLIWRCLAYAQTDAEGEAIGRAETMVSEMEKWITENGFAWSPPAKPPSQRLALRDDGTVLVDGKPFFPLGLYNVSEASDVEELARLGFNTVFNSGNEEFLDACDRSDVMFIAHGPGENMQNFSSLVRVRRHMEEVYWRPSLLAWYVVDEPSLRSVPVEVIRRASDLVKTIDPHHLTLICDGAPYRSKPYQSLADVACPAHYPIWKQQSLTLVARCLDETVSAIGDEQPLWFVVQAFTWRNIRFPTVQEERCMTYLAVIHGARGISWYAYKYPNKEILLSVFGNSPELWHEILREVRELNELASILVGRRPRAHVEQVGLGRLDWCVVERGDQVLVMVCNPSRTEVSHALAVGEMEDVEVLWEGRSLGDVHGSLADVFPPMSVRVYRGRRPSNTGVT